ncbi:hypothetical protein, partial [Bacillus cereus]|uniref:hypothetical protein n=1 Tax=Bacillus cereus TaxID=1396 RepID=UPI003204BD20
EALFASSEGAKRLEILAARAGHCFRRILRWEYECPLMRGKYEIKANKKSERISRFFHILKL